MAPTEEAEDEAQGDVPAQNAEEECDEISWADLRLRLRIENSRMQRLLELFEEHYAIGSPSEAFVQIRPFLGEYLVREFDHAAFCKDLGESESTVSDLGLGCSLMLRIAVAVAKAFSLEMSDWADINEACSEAPRLVPACYALQRALPGALNVARNLRFSLAPEQREFNPWLSDEGQKHFKETHGLEWDEVLTFTSQDQQVCSCFAGLFLVSRITPVQQLAIVALDALRVDEAPGGFPKKSIAEEDSIIWEVEASIGSLLEPGIVVDADWCELQNELCFVSLLRYVGPAWQRPPAEADTSGTALVLDSA